ncbi:MAG TPA: hypothetical protein VJC10_01570 [Patescibacteria group bacterium]|nr:hypothetical protein [Patescibacteria group bacterium]
MGAESIRFSQGAATDIGIDSESFSHEESTIIGTPEPANPNNTTIVEQGDQLNSNENPRTSSRLDTLLYSSCGAAIGMGVGSGLGVPPALLIEGRPGAAVLYTGVALLGIAGAIVMPIYERRTRSTTTPTP